MTDKSNNKENLNEAETPVFIKEEELNDKKEKIDYSKIYVLPLIKTRYFSMLIDVIIIVLLALGISTIIEKIGEVPDYVRGILFVLIILLYEPILVSFGSTVGQLVLNIRVRSFLNPEKKVPFHMVLIRFIIKIFLGWLSFLTVTFNINRRAIHDFAGGSIMIANKIEDK